jgi:pilus assembly protein Flp/PilA
MRDEMSIFLKRFATAEDGVTAVEYGLIALLVALAVIVGIAAVGTKVGAMYGNVASKFPQLPG